MSIFKRFASEPEPTKQELADALAFKNILKYGDNVNAKYKESRKLYQESRDLEADVQRVLEKAFRYETRDVMDNWTSFKIATYKDCTKSPIGQCLYISYFGNENPQRDDKPCCLCCDEELY